MVLYSTKTRCYKTVILLRRYKYHTLKNLLTTNCPISLQTVVKRSRIQQRALIERKVRMEQQDKRIIVEELDRRINDAKNSDKYDEVLALKNFKDWFVEMYIF